MVEFTPRAHAQPCPGSPAGRGPNIQAQERGAQVYWSGFYPLPDANWPAPSRLLNVPKRERAMGLPNHGKAGAGSDLLLLMSCMLH